MSLPSRLSSASFWMLVSEKLAKQGYKKDGPDCARYWQENTESREEEDGLTVEVVAKHKESTLKGSHTPKQHWSSEETKFFFEIYRKYREEPNMPGYAGNQEVLSWGKLLEMHNAQGCNRSQGALQEKIRPKTTIMVSTVPVNGVDVVTDRKFTKMKKEDDEKGGSFVTQASSKTVASLQHSCIYVSILMFPRP